VHTQDRICDHTIPSFINIIWDDEDKSETGEEGVGKCIFCVGLCTSYYITTLNGQERVLSKRRGEGQRGAGMIKRRLAEGDKRQFNRGSGGQSLECRQQK